VTPSLAAIMALALGAQGAGGAPARGDDGPAAIKIAVVEPAGSEAIGADTRRAVGSLIAGRLSESGAFSVITQDDVEQMVSFDRLKSSLSCDDDASCLAEIGGALGVQWLIASTVAKVGPTLVLSMTLVDAESVKVESRETLTGDDVAAIIGQLPTTVDRLVRTLLAGRQGTLKLFSNVDDAIVEIDGRLIGPTPVAELTLTQGQHRVVVKKAGFYDFAADVDIRPGATSEVSATMAAAELGDDLRFLTIGGLVTAGGGAVIGGIAYVASVVAGLGMLQALTFLGPIPLATLVPVVGPAVTLLMHLAIPLTPAQRAGDLQLTVALTGLTIAQSVSLIVALGGAGAAGYGYVFGAGGAPEEG
jgi:hypothetical protein